MAKILGNSKRASNSLRRKTPPWLQAASKILSSTAMAPVVKDFLSLYPKILESVMADENVDALFNVLWADSTGMNIESYIKAYEGVKGHYQKPLVSWVYGPDKGLVRDIAERVENLGFPVFSNPETAIKAMGLALRYARIRGAK